MIPIMSMMDSTISMPAVESSSPFMIWPKLKPHEKQKLEDDESPAPLLVGGGVLLPTCVAVVLVVSC